MRTASSGAARVTPGVDFSQLTHVRILNVAPVEPPEAQTGPGLPPQSMTGADRDAVSSENGVAQ